MRPYKVFPIQRRGDSLRNLIRSFISDTLDRLEDFNFLTGPEDIESGVPSQLRILIGVPGGCR